MSDNDDVRVTDDIWRPTIRIFLYPNDGRYKTARVFGMGKGMDWNEFLQAANDTVRQDPRADRVYSVSTCREIVQTIDMEDDCYYVLVPRGHEFNPPKRKMVACCVVL